MPFAHIACTVCHHAAERCCGCWCAHYLRWCKQSRRPSRKQALSPAQRVRLKCVYWACRSACSPGALPSIRSDEHSVKAHRQGQTAISVAVFLVFLVGCPSYRPKRGVRGLPGALKTSPKKLKSAQGHPPHPLGAPPAFRTAPGAS